MNDMSVVTDYVKSVQFSEMVRAHRFHGGRGEGIVVGRYGIAVCGAGECWRSHARGAAGLVCRMVRDIEASALFVWFMRRRFRGLKARR